MEKLQVCINDKSLSREGEVALRFDHGQRESLLTQEIVSDGITSLHLNERLNSAEEIAKLTRTLLCSRQLRTLSVSYNNLGAKLGTLIEALSAGRLASAGLLPELRSLNLTGNALGDQTFAMLGAALANGALPRLSHLMVTGNRLTTIAPLVDAATCGPLGLEVLKCENNAVEDESIEAFVSAVRDGRFPKLHALWLGGNKLTDKGLQALALVVGEGAQIQTVSLSLNHFSHGGMEEFRERVGSSARLIW